PRPPFCASGHATHSACPPSRRGILPRPGKPRRAAPTILSRTRLLLIMYRGTEAGYILRGHHELPLFVRLRQG
ncbi:unnamed protein product, partial [Amoebophrya sp. A120]